MNCTFSDRINCIATSTAVKADVVYSSITLLNIGPSSQAPLVGWHTLDRLKWWAISRLFVTKRSPSMWTGMRQRTIRWWNNVWVKAFINTTLIGRKKKAKHVCYHVLVDQPVPLIRLRIYSKYLLFFFLFKKKNSLVCCHSIYILIKFKIIPILDIESWQGYKSIYVVRYNHFIWLSLMTRWFVSPSGVFLFNIFNCLHVFLDWRS